MFQKGKGDWTEYKKLPDSEEVDFHWSEYGHREKAYWEVMQDVQDKTFDALEDAQARKIQYVIFTHGYSTSGPFKTTARSVVRGIMRSKGATPYIIRKRCIQHHAVFVAAIRYEEISST